MYTYLKQVGEVDEHIVPRLLLSTRDVNANSYDVHTSSSPSKLMLQSEGIETGGGE